MDLNLLAQFEAVARTASFSAAARELGLPKSTVSRGVARLEAALGVQLLFRTTRSVKPSEAGSALQDRVAPLLGSMRAALGDLPEQAEAPVGLLRVTAPTDLGQLLLPEIVARYAARYPAVSVELALTGRVVDLVREGFDVALRVAARLQDSTLQARRVAPLRVRLYGSPTYLARRGAARSERELADHEWVVFRTGPSKLRLAGPEEVMGVTPRERILCDDILFARDALRAGAGIGLLPTFVAEPEVVAGTLVRLLPRAEWQAGSLFIVSPAARHVPPKVTAFRDLAAELLRRRAGAD